MVAYKHSQSSRMVCTALFVKTQTFFVSSDTLILPYFKLTHWHTNLHNNLYKYYLIFNGVQDSFYNTILNWPLFFSLNFFHWNVCLFSLWLTVSNISISTMLFSYLFKQIKFHSFSLKGNTTINIDTLSSRTLQTRSYSCIAFWNVCCLHYYYTWKKKKKKHIIIDIVKLSVIQIFLERVTSLSDWNNQWLSCSFLPREISSDCWNYCS